MPTYCSCTNWRVLRSASEAFGPENAFHIQLLTEDPFPQCSKLYYVLAYRKDSILWPRVLQLRHTPGDPVCFLSM